MSKAKLKLFPASQVAVDLLGSGFSIDDKTLTDLEALHKIPTVQRAAVQTPLNPSQLKDVCVEPVEVNALLASSGYRVIWSPKAKRISRKTPAPQISWKLRVQQQATIECLRLYALGANPSISDLANSMAKWCVKNKVVAERGIPPLAGYIRVHVLAGKHWTKPSKPPKP
jgi:hypothetical protein